MIPFFEWRVIPAGPFAIQVWGLWAAIGVISGTWFAVRTARRTGLDGDKVEALAFRMIVAAFLGARLFHVLFYEPGHYLSHPLEVLEVWKGGLSSFGGFVGAAIVFFWRVRASKLPILKTADVFMTALPLGLGCGRIGCFLIHDHPGTLAHGFWRWLAVSYPGGARYDLGLLLGLFDFLAFSAFLALSRRPRKDGFFAISFVVAYAPARFFLDFLREIDIRYFGLTPGQYGAVAMLIFGLASLLRLRYAERVMPRA